jgi:hypothetical protein
MSPIIAPPQTPTSLALLQLGRLALPTVGHDFKEAVGEPLDTVGAGVALGQRRPKGYAFTVPLLAIPDGSATDQVAAGNRMRRQLRSMLHNAQLRGQGLYLQFVPDREIDGWVVPGNGQIAWEPGGPTFGNYTLSLDEIYRVGTRWTHRPGLRFVVVDRRLASTARDFLGQIHSTDFASLTALGIVRTPIGADKFTFASGTVVLNGFWTGKDGNGYNAFPVDGDVVSYEIPEASMNLGQVVAYDRRGHITVPATGPDPLWEEVYGSNYPWNWLTASQPADCPVLDNGVVRVRLDTANTIGLAIDKWTGSAWAEQGKITAYRIGDSSGYDDTFVSASLVEWTPERAVMLVVLNRAADLASFESIYVTLERGWGGPRVEMYVANDSGGPRADGLLIYAVKDADTNGSVLQLGSPTHYAATAGSGSALFSGVSLGPFFTENHYSIVREGGAYQVNFAVLQAGLQAVAGVDASGYVVSRNAPYVQSGSGTGYVSVQLGYSAQAVDQTVEAEAIRNTLSGTTSQVADATASGGQCVQDTQAGGTITLFKGSTTLDPGAVYRAMVHAKVDAGATGSFAVLSGANAGSLIPTTTSSTWVWLDAGDLRIPASPDLKADAWRSAGAGNVYIDRIELVKLEGRATSLNLFDGARDLGQAALIEARAIAVQVER